MSIKRQLTEEVIKNLPELTVEELFPLMWFNLRASGGPRLTKFGFEILTEHLDLETYDIAVDPVEFDTRILLALDRKLKMPYYINVEKKLVNKVVFFGSQEAVLAILHGSLVKFLIDYE